MICALDHNAMIKELLAKQIASVCPDCGIQLTLFINNEIFVDKSYKGENKMITINGKVSKMELNDNSDHQTIQISAKILPDALYHSYIHLMFKGKSPFELGQEVTLTISSKADELPAQIA